MPTIAIFWIKEMLCCFRLNPFRFLGWLPANQLYTRSSKPKFLARDSTGVPT